MMAIKHLYVHVPFCNSICYYCDFCHRIYDESLADKWLNILASEISDKCHDNYETIYIGGGTPSSLSLIQLDRLFSLIKPFSSKTIEYTAEVNPESLDIDKINLFKKYHINRISMGVQTSDDALLKAINRKYCFNDVKEKIKLLKDNGISNISIDLMYSLPKQTLLSLKNTLVDFLELDVPHVSLYSLTIEENTVFGKRGYQPLDIDTEADMYEMIVEYLKIHNYSHYEVSNFAKKGFESKHNLGYWLYEDFLGVSLAAASKVGNKRWTNTYNFKEYFNDYNSKNEDLTLSLQDQKFETIMMNLRLSKGINIAEFNKRYDCNLLNEYSQGISNPNIDIKNGYLYCKNRELLNNTLLDFMK